MLRATNSERKCNRLSSKREFGPERASERRTDVHEEFIDVRGSLRRGLDEEDGVVVCVLLCFLDGDRTVLSEIDLVSDEGDDNV